MSVQLNTADDLYPGYRIQLGQKTLTEEAITEFAEKWDPQWFHTDPIAAVVAGRGFDRLRFTAPVRPGDTLSDSATVNEVSLDETRGRVEMAIEMHDQDGTTVFTATMTVFLWRRGHGPAVGG